MGQEAGPHQIPNLPASWSWTSQHPELWKINVCWFKPPSLCNFVIARTKTQLASLMVTVCMVYFFPSFHFQPICVLELQVCRLDSIWLDLLKCNQAVPAVWVFSSFIFNMFINMVEFTLAIFVFCVPHVFFVPVSNFHCLLLC